MAGTPLCFLCAVAGDLVLLRPNMTTQDLWTVSFGLGHLTGRARSVTQTVHQQVYHFSRIKGIFVAAA